MPRYSISGINALSKFITGIFIISMAGSSIRLKRYRSKKWINNIVIDI